MLTQTAVTEQQINRMRHLCKKNAGFGTVCHVSWCLLARTVVVTLHEGGQVKCLCASFMWTEIKLLHTSVHNFIGYVCVRIGLCFLVTEFQFMRLYEMADAAARYYFENKV